MDLSIFGIQNSTLMVTALVTGLGLVAAAVVIALLISPRSFTIEKGKTFECGVSHSW